MEPFQREESKFPVAGVLVLAAVIGGVLVYQAPLKTSRPAATKLEKQAHETFGEIQVQARLWEDPFVAAEQHEQGETLKKIKDQFHHKSVKVLPENDRSDTAVFIAMVDGSPYAEGTESRIRHRYAVLSALGVAGFVPYDSEHIGYFYWSEKGQSLRIPYEWFLFSPARRGKEHQWERILVLWAKDSAFSACPRSQLTNIIHHVDQDLHPRPRNLEFKILGPRGSTTLRAMFRKAKESCGTSLKKQEKGILQEVEVYSPWATASDQWLFEEIKISLPNEPVSLMIQGSDKPPSFAFRVFRTIGTDRELAEAVIKELKYRGVKLGVGHIALISEWDTFYGRTLPLTFTAEATRQGNTPSPSGDGQGAPSWVHSYSYLRGLDGEIPSEAGRDGQKPKPDEGGKKAQANLMQPNIKELEQPEGKSQLDYVRRLADRIEAKDRELRQRCSPFEDCPGIKAIGVLGSDVYDKLLILQALRPYFPDAMFFTTDLDARLYHPSQYEWTRNLLIASHFGLELDGKLQGDIPPFRDSYQTSVFWSVLQATRPKDGEHVLVGNLTSPQLFEVGRSGPVSLSQPSSDVPSGWEILFSTVALLLALILMWQARILRFSFAAAVLAVLLVVGVAGYGVIAIYSDSLEPVALLEGVSVWPTEGLRLLAFLMTVAFFFDIGRRLKESNRSLEKYYFNGGGNEKDQDKISSKPVTGQTMKAMRSWPALKEWEQEPETYVNSFTVWKEYLAFGSGWFRLVRVAVPVALFFIFGMVVMRLFGLPHIPCRGDWCFKADALILIISVVAFVWLIFVVVDAMTLCASFIARLVAKPTEWPTHILEKFRKERNMDPSLLEEWLDIRFIAERTDSIGKMMYYPFLILFLMVVSRHTAFDNWDFPLGLIIILSLSAMFALWAAFVLRRAGEKARRKAVRSLRNKLFQLKGEGEGHRHRFEQVQMTIQEIESNRAGAFAPLGQHPIFRSVAFPSGAFGILVLIEYLATGF